MKLIIVRGGMVQGVYSDGPEEVHVIDYDCDEASKMSLYEREASRLIKMHNLQEIY